MNKSPSKCLIRLLVLFVLSAAFFVLLLEPKASAVDDYSCATNLGLCTYQCAVSHQNDLPAYQACNANCELNYNSCSSCAFTELPPDCEGEYDFPEPYPVVANYTQCMDNCANCLFLPLAERGACFSPCKIHCIEAYGD